MTKTKSDAMAGVNELIKSYSRIDSEVELKRYKDSIKALRKTFKDNETGDVFVRFLTFLRQRKLISVPDEYILNKLEMDKCTNEATHHVKLDAGAYRLELGEKYKYSKKFDDVRLTDMYTFYIPRTIEGEEQIGKELDRKIRRGFMPEEGDYPDAKVVIDRRILRESEFLKYFEIESEE